jgi:hypothetical protein
LAKVKLNNIGEIPEWPNGTDCKSVVVCKIFLPGEMNRIPDTVEMSFPLQQFYDIKYNFK